jgi:outer membrane receptor protein involved in Fe transport
MPVPRAPLLILLLALTCAEAVAGTPPAVAADASVFEPGELSNSADASAYDLLLRVPGFSLVEADAEVRGYAGAQGNVLVDGVRPVSKNESVKDLLQRLPARAIERLELLRTAAPGVDMAGFAVLLNVVRRRETQRSTQVEGGVLAASDGWTAMALDVDHEQQVGGGTLELSLSIAPELDHDSGDGSTTVSTPDGLRSTRSDFQARVDSELRELSADWQPRLAHGTLGASAAWREELTRADEQQFGADSGALEEAQRERESLRESELGLRYGRELGAGGKLDLVLSQRLGWMHTAESASGGGETEQFDAGSDSSEHIARVEWTLEPAPSWQVALSAEGAINALEGSAKLSSNGQPVPLPGSEVRIEERRSELAAGATRNSAAEWSVDFGLRLENSRIAQSGDTTLQRSFQYWKPRFALDWRPSGENRLHLSLSREVGQLEFAEFVASASLDDGTVTAGNAELEPDKTWRLSAAWERRLWQGAALTLTAAHERITDVVDRLLVQGPDGAFDAPGNIGDGRRDSLDLQLSAPLDRFGLAGGLLRASLLWRDSEVTDPVTGELRPISEEEPFEGEIELSREVPSRRLHWGVELELGKHEYEYRFDQVRRDSEALGWSAFVERRFGGHWRLRAEAANLFGRRFEEYREQYPGPRGSNPTEEIEVGEWRTPGTFSLKLRYSVED